jgi:5-methylthioadenosine/S-adenosylhomocysteine deaminase
LATGKAAGKEARTREPGGPPPQAGNGAPRPVDLLVTGATVVAFDDAGTVIADGAIAVEGNRIAWIGSAREARTRFRAVTVLDAIGQVAMPGLTDCHFHTAQQFLRGKLVQLSRTQTLKMPPWRNYYLPYEAMLGEEDIRQSGLCAYLAMVSVGTTCFLEAGGPHPDAMGEAADAVGIRGVVAYSTIDADDSVPPSMRMTTRDALRRTESLVKRWSKHPRVRAWPALRQIMVCTERLQVEMAALAVEHGVKLHTHLAEGAYEIDYALARWGQRPAEYLDSLGVLGPHLLAAHSVLLSVEEMELYVARKVAVAHCAFNNYHVGVPRLLEMIRRGVPVGFGTDGAGSWGPLDLFQVAHAARIGQQLVHGTPNHYRGVVSSEELLAVAVRGGVRLAGLGDEAGQLAPGRLADFILVDAGTPDQYPNHDPMFTLASASTGANVRSVVIDGRVVMRERVFLTIDEDEVRAGLDRHLPALMKRFDAAVG